MAQLEANFSRLLVSSIERKGVPAVKLSDKVRKGVPDIYVTGGTWIESKFLHFSNNSRTGRSVLPFFSEMQKLTLGEFSEAGDQCFAAMCFPDFLGKRGTSYFMLTPWRYILDHPVVTARTIQEFGVPKEGKFWPVPFFDKNMSRNIDRDAIAQVYGKDYAFF